MTKNQETLDVRLLRLADALLNGEMPQGAKTAKQGSNAVVEFTAALHALENVAAWIGCNVFPPETHHLEELRKVHAAINCGKKAIR
jgi:hypothetical protein